MTARSLIRVEVAITIVAFGFVVSGCRQATPVETPIAEPLNTVPVFRFDDLGPANKKDFEKAFPTDVREVFDNAIELRVSSGRAGEDVAVTDPSEKRMILDALYWDLANSYPRASPETAVACKETGPIISTTYRDENLMEWKYSIRPSYFCGWFDVGAKGKNYSTLFRSKNVISNSLILELLRRHMQPMNSSKLTLYKLRTRSNASLSQVIWLCT